MSEELCDGRASLVGISRPFTDMSNRMFSLVKPTSLERRHTCFRAAINHSGLDARGYRPPFISCIVLNTTLSHKLFTSEKNSIYCASATQFAISRAVKCHGDTVM